MQYFPPIYVHACCSFNQDLESSSLPLNLGETLM